jgi:hypothetical protein
MIRVVHPGSGFFTPIPDPGVKKAPHPESGSATLLLTPQHCRFNTDEPYQDRVREVPTDPDTEADREPRSAASPWDPPPILAACPWDPPPIRAVTTWVRTTQPAL